MDRKFVFMEVKSQKLGLTDCYVTYFKGLGPEHYARLPESAFIDEDELIRRIVKISYLLGPVESKIDILTAPMPAPETWFCRECKTTNKGEKCSYCYMPRTHSDGFPEPETDEWDEWIKTVPTMMGLQDCMRKMPRR